MKSSFKNYVYPIISIFFWILVWQISSTLIDLDYIFPGVIPTFKRLFELMLSSEFYLSIALSILRILLGYILGIVLGIILTLMTVKSKLINTIVSHMIVIVKSTPVASFIMILWVLIGSSYIPTAIGLLMVMPIIWQNLSDGYNSIDPKLSEVADIFELSFAKKLKHVIFPVLKDFLIPGMLTSIGLAWKSGIAAEILTYTKNSIGKQIQDSKAFFDGASLLAWTITVIVISLLFEYLIKLLIRRFKLSNVKAD